MSTPSAYKDYEAVIVDGPNGTRRIRLVQPAPPPDPKLLDKVRQCTTIPKGKARTAKMRATIPAAHEGGWPVTEIARTSQLSRQTVYTILNRAAEEAAQEAKTGQEVAV